VIFSAGPRSSFGKISMIPAQWKERLGSWEAGRLGSTEWHKRKKTCVEMLTSERNLCRRHNRSLAQGFNPWKKRIACDFQRWSEIIIWNNQHDTSAVEKEVGKLGSTEWHKRKKTCVEILTSERNLCRRHNRSLARGFNPWKKRIACDFQRWSEIIIWKNQHDTSAVEKKELWELGGMEVYSIVNIQIQ
jgi:F0F1-type ATP synthase gamma subunit